MKKDFFREKNELDKDLWELEKRQAGIRRFESVLKLYSIMGIVVAVFGIAYFVLTTLDIQLNTNQQIALLTSGVGLTLSAASWFLLVMRRERLNDELNKLKSMQELSEFLWKWSRFEEVSKNILSRSDKEFNRHSIREVIELLLKNKVIDGSDALALDEAIQARNMAVHGGSELPKTIVAEYSKKLDEVVNKILKSDRL